MEFKQAFYTSDRIKKLSMFYRTRLDRVYYTDENIELNRILSIMEEIIKPGDTCLDLGSNIGTMTLVMSILCYPGKVIAVEPELDNVLLLKENLKANNITNVLIKQVAIWNENTTKILYKNKFNFGDHRISDHILRGRAFKLIKNKKSIENINREEVNTINLDFISEELGKIDFIKSDIQGSEYAMFQGGQNLFAKNKDCVVITECWPVGLGEHYDAFCNTVFNLFNNVEMIDTGEKILNADTLKAFEGDECNLLLRNI